MIKKIGLILIYSLFTASSGLFAQTKQFSSWTSIFYTQKISSHWGTAFDMQFRSANQLNYLKTIFIRPSINYYFSPNNSVALGYAYIINNSKTGDCISFRPENRIWEQYLVTLNLTKNITLTNRFRLEQRFYGNSSIKVNDSYFSQRLRYFVRTNIPLNKKSVFNNGIYIGLQNELFLNVQNKVEVNNHLFDQNRSYISLGYRFNKNFDIELGYLNQYIQQTQAHTINNVAQITSYIRL